LKQPEILEPVFKILNKVENKEITGKFAKMYIIKYFLQLGFSENYIKYTLDNLKKDGI
jgi:hypothetical protein